MLPRAFGAAALAALSIAVSAYAGERPVRLRALPPVRPHVDAVPLIAAPLDEAERRINAALGRFNTTVRRAVAGCMTYAGRPGAWQRTVEVPMRGPGYLSVVIRDESFCDGAHPSSGLMSIVYDLRTGAPVDWSKLLPPSLAGRLTLQEGSDGTRMVTMASERLFALYLAGYGARGVPQEERADCRAAVAVQGSERPPAMMAWLDARAGGLVVQFDLPNVVQACAEPVVISAAALADEGADPGLLAQLRKD